MASIASLTRGLSLIPTPGGGWKVDITVKTKFKWNFAKVKRSIEAGSIDALYKAGADVREATRKQMSRRRPLGSKKETIEEKQRVLKKWKIASRHGYDLIALIDRVPKSDRVTSWLTDRFPTGYLRSQIQSDLVGKKSVIIGPEAGNRSPRVNQLLERGGTATYYFVPGGQQRRSGNKVYGTLTNRRPMVGGRNGSPMMGLYSFTRYIKPRGFMAKGLEKAMPKIPAAFKNRIRQG